MSECDTQELADLLLKLAEIFDDFADLAEALAVESYATHQRVSLFPELL
jgi:hypothetical protein